MIDDTRKVLNDAVTALQAAKGRIKKLESKFNEPIAIVSMACRLPAGINTPEEYWKILQEGKDLIEEFPKDRWDAKELYDPNPEAKGKTYCKEGGFLRDIDKFDATFFGISPREANSMDPQQRLVLETSWEALERMGTLPLNLNTSKTGVYIGAIATFDEQTNLETLDGYAGTGKLNSVISGRIAYTLGLQGPAITVDTACSSSLVAIHLAAQALRLGECDLALAGGVTVMLSPAIYVEFSRLKGMAIDGRCKSFSAKADGTSWSEGCGILVLKRLSDAQKDKDKILAVIRGTAINQDGRSQGLTAPNGPSQQKVIQKALELSNLKPSDIDAIEAHGTGTTLGDPIEATSLAEVFASTRPEGKPLYLGSSKSNLGHSQAAAGVTGLMKMVLALQNQSLPKTLHAETPSPNVKWEGSGLELLTSAKNWQPTDRPRRCGISSFGISGTNAHIILEEAPTNDAADNNTSAENKPNNSISNLLLLSGQTPEALEAQAAQFAKYIEDHPQHNLSDICHTAALHRTHFSHRLALQSDKREQLIEQLKAYADKDSLSEVESGVASSKPIKIAFLFTGQGSQYAGMAKELYQKHSLFKTTIDQCANIIDPLIQRSILELIFANTGSKEAELLNQTRYTQPALFAVEYALYQLWSNCGIKKPLALLGHSIGELVAATIAGVFSLEDGLKLAVARGQLMFAMQPGSMLSVDINEQQAQELINKFDGKLSIAGLNAPLQTVISGETSAIKELIEQLKEQTIKHKELVVSHAFHSQMMDKAATGFEQIVSRITRNNPSIAVVSNVTGKIEKELLTEPTYWSKQLRQAVRFTDGLKTLTELGITTFIELGPQPILSGLGTQINSGNSALNLNFYGSLKKNQSDTITLSKTVASLWLEGIELDWKELLPGKFVPIPTYPFQREKYWLETTSRSSINRSTGQMNGQRVDLPDGQILHIIELSPKIQTELADHIIHGQMVLAGAYYLSILLTIAQHYWPDQPIEIKGFRILRAFIFDNIDELVRLHISLQAEENGFAVSVYSFRKEEWVKYIETHISACEDLSDNLIDNLDIDDNLNESSLSLRELDEVLKAVSVEWGEEWWAIDQAVETSSGILSRYRLPKHTRSTPFCPVALDNAFGSMFWLLANSGKELIEKGTPILPIAIDKLVWYGNKGHIRWAEHRLSQEFNSQSETTKSQLSLWDESGKPLLSILGFRTRRAAAQQFLSKTNAALHTINWQILNLTVDNKLSQPQVALIGKELNSKSNVGELLNQNVESVLCYRDLNMLCDALDNGVTTPELIIVEFINETYINEQLAHNAIIKTQELLTFVQSWLKDKRLISTTLVIITKHAVLVGEAQQELSLTYTPIIGLIASIQNEYPNRNIKLIDIDENDNWPLINSAVNSEYKQLALRKHQLFYPSLKAIKPNTQEKTELKLNGTVLITGGLGSLGKEVARYLAKELLVKHLLLVSRQGSTTAEANELIRELAEYGANATVATCNVANYEELQNLIDSIPTNKALCGIIHCAGIIDDGLVLQQTVDRLEKVMLPKVMGAWNLHLLTKDKQLTMFILFSSLAATLGNPGQSNYAAANRFLDGLAQYRQQQGLAAQSLAWTAWAEVGMVARLSENARHQLAGQDINALSTAEALKLFRDALTRPEPILIPAQLNIEKTKRGISSTQKDTKIKDFSALKLQLQELTPTQREQALLDIITQELASVLSMTAKEKIDINRPFTEMGLDSLMAVELRDRISKKTSLNLPATLAFDYPSLKQVASFLSEKLGYDKAVITAKTKPTFKTKQQAIEPIAIVSVACQFPGGVKDLESFWQLLIEGRDAITTVPTERWDVEKYFDTNPEIKGKTYAKWGGFLGDIRQFDAGFFGISPREAVSLDPQQRLLLETSWEVLENAGIVPEQIMGSNIGVYIGMCGHEYLTKVFADPEQIDAYSLLGTQHSATVGRLSYILGLKGPNLPIDTACSSSLVAVHLAVQALRQNECDGALVGGVNLIIDPKSHIYFSKLKALSPRGKCHTFSADADGYVRGEGCAMLYLKRLSDAQRDNDSILAVIRGTAVNQDGRSNGMTAPNGPSQQAVIKAALNQANIDASSVSYVECHGTGTPLGDPIEVQSLAAVYGAERSQSEPVYIGSVKTNFGHTEGAAGIAGVIKAALCLQKQKLVKSLHFTAPNPHIPWSEIPVKVLTSEMDWLSNGTPRRVGVSSFGFSGTNAHAILEEAPELAVKQDNLQKSARNILLLSGQTEQALRSQARKYAEHIEQHTEQDLADICYSAVVHRTHFDHRLALEVQDREQIIEQLKEFALNGYANEINSTIAKTKTPKIAFLFTGQGAQYVGMAKQLYQQEPLFRETLNRCAAIIDPLIEKSILEIIFTEIIDSNGALIDQTQYTQPALFAIEYSLYKLWSELGVQAEVLLGHSIGELVAATCSGVFSLEDGLKLAVERGRLMWRLPKGAMISIEADEAKALTLIDPLKNDISIAGINAPNQTVISGNSTAIKAFTDILKKANVKYKELTVSHAFHSQMMDAMLEQFEDFVTKLELNKAVISIASNLTGKIERDCFTDPKYWSSQIRQPVRFLPAIKNLLDSGINTFIELGPQPVLSGLITQAAGSSYNNLQITTIPSLKRQTTDNKTFADAIFSLWVNRVVLDWRRLFAGKLVALPNYQFQRQHYWLKSNPTIPVKASSGRYSLSGERIKLPDGKLFYRVEISPAIQKYLADHLVYNTIVVPGAFYLSVLLAVAEACWPNSAIELKDIHFVRALIFPNEESRTSLFVQLEPVEQGYKVTLSSEDKDENWTTHAIGEIYPLTKNTTPLPDYLTKDQIDKITELGFDVESPLNKNNIEWGKQWCWTKKAQRVSEEIARCLFITPEGVVNNDSPIAGAFIDNGLILEFFLSTQDELNNDYTTRVPFAIKSLRWYGEHTIPLMAQYKLNSKTEHSSNGDIVYYDNNGCPLASITGFTTQSVSIEKFLPGLKNNNLYKLGWVKLLPNNETTVKNSLILGSKELADQLGSYYFENIAELFQYIDGNGSPEQIIIDATQNSPDLISQLRDNTYNNLNNIQAILSKNELSNTELIWVTQGAIATDIKDQDDRQIANLTLSWSPLVGLLRTARSEHPKRSIRLIDKDNSTTTGLLKIAINNNSEPEILLRSGVMFGTRLQVVEQKAVDSMIESPALTLNIIKQGDLDGIALKPNSNALAKLSSKQVRIAVQASGINFRDVLNVLGMYPGDAGAFGGEGAGVVLEVGSEVTTFAAGDRVMGFIPWAFSTMAISESNKLLPLPKAWSYEDGATVMGAFLTAWYGLVKIAKLKRGEKILIHAATGGVGSAAIQVAKYIGAEIFATAHPSKWDILKGWGLDDNHISTSRTLDFEKDFLTFTDSKGVDVVLHSLAREFTDASLRLMPNGGRFIEIGKIDLRDSEQVASTYKGVQYLPFDLYNEPETVMSAMLTELNTLFNQGVFKPLAYSNWNLKDAPLAFRHMAQAKHIGKVVLSSPRVIDPAGVVLITGGTGSLGSLVATHLVQQYGVRRLALLSRQGLATPEALKIKKQLEENLALVDIYTCDIANKDELKNVIEQISQKAPLTGVVHCAGTLADGLLLSQNIENFNKVLLSKVDGAWNLHQLTKDKALDLFVMFSSMSGIIGNPGQSNYAAANTFLDALAIYRRTQGLPAQSLAWGLWQQSESGMTAHLSQAELIRMKRQGLEVITEKEGLALFDKAISLIEPLLIPANLNLETLSKQPVIPSLLSEIIKSKALKQRTEISHQKSDLSLKESLKALPENEQFARLLSIVTKEITHILAIPESNPIPPEKLFQELGLDSLMAVETRNRLSTIFAIDLPISSILLFPTAQSLTLELLRLLQLDSVKDNATGTNTSETNITIKKVSRNQTLPLSFSQQRIWFASQLEPNSPYYNLPFALKINGKLQVAALEQSINEIVNRHEILRTTYTMVDGIVSQIVNPIQRLFIEKIDLQNLDQNSREAETQNLIAQSAGEVFDLTTLPLIKVKLLQLQAEQHLLLLTIHHIAIDGWSADLLFRELGQLYQAFSQNKPSPLPELEIQYADYSYWQRNWFTDERLNKDLDYWKQQLEGIKALQLPTDRPKPIVPTGQAATIYFNLSSELASNLKKLAQKENVTLYNIMLAALNVLLYRYTGQEDICIGSATANRNQLEIETLIGCFINILIIRNNLSGNPSFSELLQRVREVSFAAFAHQDLPVEKIFEQLKFDRNKNVLPHQQMGFSFQRVLTSADWQLANLNLELRYN